MYQDSIRNVEQDVVEVRDGLEELSIELSKLDVIHVPILFGTSFNHSGIYDYCYEVYALLGAGIVHALEFSHYRHLIP